MVDLVHMQSNPTFLSTISRLSTAFCSDSRLNNENLDELHSEISKKKKKN